MYLTNQQIRVLVALISKRRTTEELREVWPRVSGTLSQLERKGLAVRISDRWFATRKGMREWLRRNAMKLP